MNLCPTVWLRRVAPRLSAWPARSWPAASPLRPGTHIEPMCDERRSAGAAGGAA